MKLLTLIICLFLSSVISGQDYYHDAQECEIRKVKINLNEAVSPELVEARLTSLFSLKKPFGFRFSYKKISPKNSYYTFQVSYRNTPLFNQLVKVIVNPQNQITQVISNIDESVLLDSKMEIFSAITEPVLKQNEKLLSLDTQYFFSGSKWQMTGVFKIKDGEGVSDHFINRSGEVLFVKPNLIEAREPVYLWVNDPDPLTTAHAVYSGQFTHNGGADSDSLTMQRVLKKLELENINDTFFLRTDSVFLEEVSAPTYSPTFITLKDTFNFTRSQKEFTDVNAFFHITDMKKSIRDYGFGLPSVILQIDAHAFSGADRSGFNYGNSPPTLEFGDGGVPDAEDADVIRHELSHSMSFSASPNTDIGLERLSIEEGQADYFAASYSRSVDTFGSNKVFNWDGNETWLGRTVNYGINYPDAGLSNGTRWTNGQIWSTGMMRVWDSCGKEVTDILMLEALYSLSPNMKMRQLANQVIEADTVWFGGVHTDKIKCAFYRNNLLKPDGATHCTATLPSPVDSALVLLNSYGFSENRSDLTLAGKFIKTVEIFDILGRKIAVLNNTENQSPFDIPRETLRVSGLYFLVVELNNKEFQTFKIIRN